ncbi:MAG: 4Fe-4S cluster-binding domain-containing protein [Thermoplasmata archaeon]|nr:4Fe-4S cluster-binding domain-containing protein [Thermoplasmata archaeon]
MVQELPNGSLVRGKLPEGCVICEKGAKMVLLVTGQCTFNCFYCPLSEEKQGRKVVYADELLVKSSADIIFEANGISAGGTGITGGDPLDNIEETLEFIKLLKEEFGKGHHIHLYTATPDKEKIKQLATVGLDEIRFHPSPGTWSKLSSTGYPGAIAAAKKVGMKTGLEIPALPDMKSKIMALIKSASEAGADFVNLNELEFSETNWRELKARGYVIKDDVSSAAKGSEKIARQLVKETELPITIHYCSASFKDGTQLRRRIMRRAENLATPLEIITDDGTFIKGVVECDDAEEMTKKLADQYDIPDDLIRYDSEKDRVEMAAWILEEIAGELDGQCFIVEEYPTADRLEVERQPV